MSPAGFLLRRSPQVACRWTFLGEATCKPLLLIDGRRNRTTRKRKMPLPPSEDGFEPSISHGECVVDRKSVFQGHCSPIHRVEHVELVLAKLKENKKIDNAFHNMWAYRIDKSDPSAQVASKSASVVQDCDDDGEQAAGGRLMTLLQILNVVNVIVIVTRWYGGIQLGPARFKHINNAARDSLVKGGFVQDGPAQPPPGGSGGGGGGKSAGKKRKN